MNPQKRRTTSTTSVKELINEQVSETFVCRGCVQLGLKTLEREHVPLTSSCL